MDDRKLHAAIANRRLVLKILSSLDVATLHRRGDQVARMDGYPNGTTDGGGTGPSALVRNEAGELERVWLTGTEAAAATKPAPDPVGRWIAEVFALLELLASTAREIDGRSKSITKSHAEMTQAAGIGVCEVCSHLCVGTDEDRLRSGYCPKDFTAWTRAGRPDRGDFKRLRQQQVS